MLTITVRGIQETVNAFNGLRPGMQVVLQTSQVESLAYTSELAQRRYLSGPWPSTLQPRTGRLRASWTPGHSMNFYSIGVQGGRARGEIGTRIPWASSHERDITIRPRNTRYLRIPLMATKTGAGVVRPEYLVPSARSLANTRIIKTRSGALYIMQVLPSARRGARSALVPIFRLKREVFRPGRPVKEPVERQAQPWVEQNLGKHITQAEAVVQTALNAVR